MLPKLQSTRVNHLWDRMRAGDANALQELYNSFYQYLFAVNFAVCMRRDLTKDCIHDAFISIWTNRDKLPPVSTVGGYLRICVRRKVIDALKKEPPLESTFLQADAEYECSYEEVVIAFQEEQSTKVALKEALSHLTNRQKEVIRLRFFENKNYEEIARLMGSEPRTVYNHMYEAIDRLRHYFSVKSAS